MWNMKEKGLTLWYGQLRKSHVLAGPHCLRWYTEVSKDTPGHFAYFMEVRWVLTHPVHMIFLSLPRNWHVLVRKYI